MRERYHFFLRRIFIKDKTDTPKISAKLVLSVSIKAINDTAGPNGLVPTLLGFSVMIPLSIRPQNLPDQVIRLKAMKEARDEAVKLVARSRLATAITSNVPAAAVADIKIGDEVLMFREEPVAKWTGPILVQSKDGKILTLDSGDRSWMALIDKIKLYREQDLEP